MLLNYNISTKGSAKNMRFKNKDFGEIVQYLMVPHGIFILTNNDLRYYNEGMGKDLN